MLVVLEAHFEVVGFAEISREKNILGNWGSYSWAEGALENRPGG